MAPSAGRRRSKPKSPHLRSRVRDGVARKKPNKQVNSKETKRANAKSPREKKSPPEPPCSRCETKNLAPQDPTDTFPAHKVLPPDQVERVNWKLWDPVVPHRDLPSTLSEEPKLGERINQRLIQKTAEFAKEADEAAIGLGGKLNSFYKSLQFEFGFNRGWDVAGNACETTARELANQLPLPEGFS